jgi:hypothetical protein
MKSRLFRALERLRHFVGRIQCRISGQCEPMTDCFEFEPGVSRFYECCRCGRDAITGQTFKQWYES